MVGAASGEPINVTGGVDLDSDGKAADYVLFMPGGYDLNKDTRGSGSTGIIGTDDTYGNAFYVINAKTGALVWKAVKSGTRSLTTGMCGSG